MSTFVYFNAHFFPVAKTEFNDITLYGFIGVYMFDCFGCVQILLRSLRRGGFHPLKTHDGWNMSGT